MNLAGKRILVTGGTGFLGKHLVNKLENMGCAPEHPGFVDFDLIEDDDVHEMFSFHEPQVVFHLAALCGGIGANQESPADFFIDNLRMGVNVINAACQFNCEKLILVGSVCSYPKHTPAPFKEEDLWNGYPEETNAPYGIAKKALLVQAQAYRKQYGLNSIYLIPANLYGPGDNFDPETSHVIPALIRKFTSGSREVTVWGDGTPTREFLYVEDAAKALIAAAEHYDGGEPVNVGTGKEITIARLAYDIAEICGRYDTANITFDPSRPNGQPRRVLDTSRAQKEFGWKATTSLVDGLDRTIEWYRGKSAKAS